MNSTRAFLLVLIATLICEGLTQSRPRGRGFRCKTRNGELGECVTEENCAEDDSFWGGFRRPRICGYSGFDELYCCRLEEKEEITASSKSSEMCEEYESLDFDSSPSLNNRFSDFSDNGWAWGTYNAIVSGEKTAPREFPHMAVLGYGDQHDFDWKCGASLISEKFVLTAAHCLFSQEYGEVKFVRVGDTDLKSTSEDANAQQFTVQRTYEHPEYRSTSRYHDIALIELNGRAVFNKYVKPACLHTSLQIPSGRLIATGWGSSDFGAPTSNFLQKVDLNYYPYERCINTYGPEKGLEQGLVNGWQLCAGGGFSRRDACQGDSGGPLQVKRRTRQLYTIVGIVSFGKLCGLAPGVYTRVSYYVPWIENLVWGN